jgi:hypothetical protein
LLPDQLGNRIANIAVGRLDVKQVGECRSDIGHVYRTIEGAMGDMPAHKEEEDMCILGVPDAVRGSFFEAVEPSGIGDEQDGAAGGQWPAPGILTGLWIGRRYE